MSKHPVFCYILQQLHDDHRFSTDPFCALTELKVLLHKAKKQTSRELSRKTPDSIGEKLSFASTALRAHRNRHLGTPIRCSEAWKPVEDCFDTSLSVSISSDSARFLLALHVKILKHVKLRSPSSLGRKQKKTVLWPDAGVDNVPGVTRNLCAVSQCCYR